MASDDTPKPKYECLKNAAANSGVADALPPPAPGTDAQELPPPRSQNSDQASFLYKDARGREHFVEAENGSSPDFVNGAPMKMFGVLHADPLPQKGDATAMGPVATDAGGFTNLDTGHEVTWDKNVAPGTVSTTADKILRCRDPKMM